MKLTENQISELYHFTQKHFVEYYDLQTELVDHLANGIETVWHENPKLAFEEVLDIEFKKFGIFGFMDVVEQRQIALTKKYHLLVWKHFKAFFEIPKILLTVTLIFLVFFMLKSMILNTTLIALLVFITLVYPVFQMIKNRSKTKKNPTIEKRWLFEEIIKNYGNSMFLANLPLQILIHIPVEKYQNQAILMTLSTFVVLYSLVAYIILKIIPSKTEDYLIETYPEYEILK